MSQPTSPYPVQVFHYHAFAHALSGPFTRPFGEAIDVQAASSLPSAVSHTLDELIVGEPLDAAGEAAARAAGWKP